MTEALYLNFEDWSELAETRRVQFLTKIYGILGAGHKYSWVVTETDHYGEDWAERKFSDLHDFQDVLLSNPATSSLFSGATACVMTELMSEVAVPKYLTLLQNFSFKKKSYDEHLIFVEYVLASMMAALHSPRGTTNVFPHKYSSGSQQDRKEQEDTTPAPPSISAPPWLYSHLDFVPKVVESFADSKIVKQVASFCRKEFFEELIPKLTRTVEVSVSPSTALPTLVSPWVPTLAPQLITHPGKVMIELYKIATLFAETSEEKDELAIHLLCALQASLLEVRCSDQADGSVNSLRNKFLTLLSSDRSYQLMTRYCNRPVRSFTWNNNMKDKREEGEKKKNSTLMKPYGYDQPIPFGLLLLKAIGSRFDRWQSDPQKTLHLAMCKFGFRQILDIPNGQLLPQWSEILREKNEMTETSYSSGKKSEWEKLMRGRTAEMDSYEDPDLCYRTLYSQLRHYASVERYFLRVSFLLAASGSSDGTTRGGTLQGVPNEVRDLMISFVLGEFSLPKRFLRDQFKFLKV